MKDVIIIGAGGFGREVKSLINDINRASTERVYNILGFVDDGIKEGTKIHEFLVLGGIAYLKTLKIKPSLVFGLGSPNIKKIIYNDLFTYDFPNIIHPSVSLEGYNIILGKGNVICKGTILTCDISLANFITLNLSCTVGHDTIINNFCSFMPSVNISGEVLINEGVYIGTGAKIINRLEIGANAIIGAGSVVTKKIPSNCTAIGIPAKPIKFHLNNEQT
jgi:sugar O-acyltransferase (sialic acid O-acetyltransferase NeuD family)